MLTPLRDIRTWSHDRRMLRLKEISVFLETADERSRMTEAMLDEGVVIMLETLRDADFDPFETYVDLLDTRQGRAWDLLGMRMLDTRSLVQRFKNGDSRERANLRSKLSRRGMV